MSVLRIFVSKPFLENLYGKKINVLTKFSIFRLKTF